MKFNYTKFFLKRNIRDSSILLIIPVLIFVILEIFTPSGGLSFTDKILIGIFVCYTIPTVVLNWFLMFKKPYIQIDNENIILNISYLTIKQKFLFSDIKESYLVKQTGIKFVFTSSFYNGTGIALHMKKGGVKYIKFICLNKHDQQKVIEIFREKGKLKE